jgi:transposase InsO family protein
MEISHAEDVFVSDITYISTEEGFCYLSIVGDAYTKKIMGDYVSRDMHSISVVKALIEAVKNRRYRRDTIHHSDQGAQYCSKTYVDALRLSNIMISMAGKGKAYENPVAERMIGILKQEYGLNHKFKNFLHAEKAVEQAINSYNLKRPHLSCGYLTPEEAHEKAEGLKNVWKRKSYSHIHKRKKEAKKEKVLLQKV